MIGGLDVDTTYENNQRISPRIDAPDRERLKTALALGLERPSDLESIAANHGTTAEVLLQLLGTEEGMRAALVEVEGLRQDGELLKRKTLPLLERLTDQIGDMIDAGQISPTAAPKVAETLFKLSGLSEERAARLRAQTEDDAPKTTVRILYSDEPEPEQNGKNYQIVIRLPHAQRSTRNVIDVTPTKEGGDDA